MNLLWKLAVAFAIVASFYAIIDNGRRVGRLEGQVCATVIESNATIGSLAYYRDHPGEKDDALARNRVVLRRFHCPVPKEKP